MMEYVSFATNCRLSNIFSELELLKIIYQVKNQAKTKALSMEVQRSTLKKAKVAGIEMPEAYLQPKIKDQRVLVYSKVNQTFIA